MNFISQVHPTAFLHDLAVVKDSMVGARTRIWQFASVIRGTVLGEDCNVAHGACLDGPVFGDRCIICHNVAMGPGFVVEDETFIGPGVVFCNDMWPSVKKDGWSLEQFQQGFITVRVGKRVIIGANSTILPGVTIGDDAVIAAGAVVDRSVATGRLFNRDGTIVMAPPENLRKRMRAAP